MVAVGIAFVLLFALIVVLLVAVRHRRRRQPPAADGRRPARGRPDVRPGRGGAEGHGVQGRRTDDEAATRRADLVLGQDPEAGTQGREGRTVVLTVSSTTIAVPDVVGKTTRQATAILRASEPRPGFVERATPTSRPGRSLEHDPGRRAPGREAAPRRTPGDAPSRASPPVAVPDVAGQDPTAAAAALDAWPGFTVTPAPTPSDTVPVGKVIGTDPRGRHDAAAERRRSRCSCRPGRT